MTLPEFISKVESKFRPWLLRLPPAMAVKLYSHSRKPFLEYLCNDTPSKPYTPPESRHKVLWDVHFAGGLFNAAGMFKSGRGYRMCALQGAGAFLAGTTTRISREGNRKMGINHPFAPYHQSGAASNWMGLPNEGHETVAKRLSNVPRLKNCPIGASLAASPEQSGGDAMQGILDGMLLYEKAGVDFMELNESCPNVPGHEAKCAASLDQQLIQRLEFISNNFLKKRRHHIPVIVKFSNDTALHQIEPLMDVLITLGYDGINLGNTSINYELYGKSIIPGEARLYNFFTANFGGGLSGRPLKDISLELVRAASEYLKKKEPGREFHIIRTGGIETKADLEESSQAGASLSQWFTGYFAAFALHGHKLYRALYENI